MPYVIVGVHGLANKSPEPIKTKWWHDALVEGLKRNCDRTSDDPLSFDFVYWANLMYPEPIPVEENMEPYIRAPGTGPLPTYNDSWKDAVRIAALGVGGKATDFAKYVGIRNTANAVLDAKLKDLARYYEDQNLREALREKLINKLNMHRDKRIMLIAHSMGTIIAYDVLRLLGRSDGTFKIEHFITIGSPLGLPHVWDTIRRENDLVRTPTIVRRWTNFADRHDVVALDAHLADDYKPNDGGVKVKDELVSNGYVGPAGKSNFHKSYGYLRTPELSNAVRAFL